jgi:hypothetical protein
MPDLHFEVTGIEPAVRGLAPLLHCKLTVRNEPATERIQAVILQAQIQIQSAKRSYNEREKERLEDVFGTPDRWGQTLRSRLWAHATAMVGSFAGSTGTVLPVQCTYDFQVIGTKYFDALEEGEVPLLFLFSGTVFYAGSNGGLQVQQIPWDKECIYRMPVQVWSDLMRSHYPNTAWLSLRRDVFDQLTAYKSSRGILTWEEVMERLLAQDPKDD